MYGFDGIQFADSLAVDEDFTVFRCVNTGHDFDYSGFAGAIFAREAMNFAGLDGKGYVVQRFDAAETFANMAQLDKIFSHEGLVQGCKSRWRGRKRRGLSPVQQRLKIVLIHVFLGNADPACAVEQVWLDASGAIRLS